MFAVTRRRPLVCACLTATLLVGQLTACTSWRVLSTPPQQFTVKDATQPIRVVRRNGAALTLEGTRVSGDTLYGTTTSKNVGVADTVVVIPLSDIQSIAVSQVSSGKTVGLVVGITLAVVAVAIYVGYMNCTTCYG